MPRLNISVWHKIGASQTVLHWIEHCVPLKFVTPPLPSVQQNQVYTLSREHFVDQEIENLLQAGSINQCTREDLICILPIKCVPKPGKKWRLVINSRKVNSYIECDKFTQEGIESVSEQIQEGDRLISIDLKNGFHHVKVQKQFRKYLGITWKGKYYFWCILALGIKSAPYYFNKILCPVVRFFRENGLHNSLFVDDFLFMISQLLLQKQKQFAFETLEKLGWQINYEKSKLIESTKCQFIGFNMFSEGPNGPWIKVLPKKLHKLKCHIQVALSLRWVTARFLAKIGGECIAMMRAVLPAKLLL